jgi:predicted metal-dependent hydrolase
VTDAVVVERQSSDPERTFPVRRVDFEETFARIDRDFAGDDVLLAHLLAALSGLFPDGEEMFIEAVRLHRDQITDPDLLRQVNAFIGQEVTHGREHRRLNARLAELGYRSQLVEETMQTSDAMTPGMERIVWLFSRFGPLKKLLADHTHDHDHAVADGDEDAPGPSPIFLLALTAALEHYTASMATLFLTDPDLQDVLADDEFFRFWAWHAIEENEHRAVAFDVYKAVGGDEETRHRAMRLGGLALVFISGYHTVVGVLTDRRSYRDFNLVRNLWRLSRNPFLSRRFRTLLKDYHRPDFHPLQNDTSELEAAWRTWLDEGGPRPHLTSG